jgi:succinate dehydrogenase / fumarate reductase flavoprotein subunit
MENYEPDAMELAPRDVVVRAMQRELNAGRGVNGEDYLHLDLTHLPREKIERKLPTINDLAKDFVKVDPARQPIPVQPTAHYSMGGIPTDLSGRVETNGGGDSWDNLYAAGEVACVSVHGANRLGANSLLEAVTFGKRAGEFAARRAAGTEFGESESEATSRYESKLNSKLSGEGSVRVHELKGKLTSIMTDKAGVFRNGEDLESALQGIRNLKESYSNDLFLEDRSKSFNTELRSALELENILDFSEFIVRAALSREESRGAHSRTDFPESDAENWLAHSRLTRARSGEIKVDYRKVRAKNEREEYR